MKLPQPKIANRTDGVHAVERIAQLTLADPRRGREPRRRHSLADMTSKEVFRAPDDAFVVRRFVDVLLTLHRPAHCGVERGGYMVDFMHTGYGRGPRAHEIELAPQRSCVVTVGHERTLTDAARQNGASADGEITAFGDADQSESCAGWIEGEALGARSVNKQIVHGDAPRIPPCRLADHQRDEEEPLSMRDTNPACDCH